MGQGLLLETPRFFRPKAKALDAVAGRDVRVLSGRTPAQHQCTDRTPKPWPSLPPQSLRPMTRLDHNRDWRADRKERRSLGAGQEDRIWGTIRPTQYPDLASATVRSRPALSVSRPSWFKEPLFHGQQSGGPSSKRDLPRRFRRSGGARPHFTMDARHSAGRLGQHGGRLDGAMGSGGSDLFLSGDLQDRAIQHRSRIERQRFQPRKCRRRI